MKYRFILLPTSYFCFLSLIANALLKKNLEFSPFPGYGVIIDSAYREELVIWNIQGRYKYYPGSTKKTDLSAAN